MEQYRQGRLWNRDHHYHLQDDPIRRTGAYHSFGCLSGSQILSGRGPRVPEYVKPDTPVFLIPTPSGKFVPLKKEEYLGWFRARLTDMGLPAMDYGVHSFRHGSVQEMLLQEENKALVQLASDHSSEAIMGFAQIPPNRRMGLSAKVNRSLARLSLGSD